MTIPTFEYCSLHYLNQWIELDSGFCSGLSSRQRGKQLAALDEAAKFYKIVRNLPTKYDTDKGLPRYLPLLEILDSVQRSEFRQNPVPGIRRVAETISAEYGGRGMLSLATKVLWLKFKSPIIVYDSQARQAIGTKNGDLEAYYSEWRQGFATHKDAIKTACAKLERMTNYTTDPDAATSAFIKRVAKTRWFHERVFDIYLWHIGGKS